MINFSDFFKDIQETRLHQFSDHFEHILNERYFNRKHGDLAAWQDSLQKLPQTQAEYYNFDSDTLLIGQSQDLNTQQQHDLESGLRGLHPWRKGPFNFYGIHIDTEWRSDWKWQRVQEHIAPLAGRSVLDVGCGSGYHCWRMYGAGARWVLGIDPSLKFLYQFHCIKQLVNSAPVHYLPLKSEDMPHKSEFFDTVFSMGVLYHRRSPFDHIEELKDALRPGGELVLETLVIPGERTHVLSPLDRYAKMPNVWFIGSSEATCQWIERMGFTDVRVIHEADTTLEEQRSTDWMQYHSLVDFLDPEDQSKTAEGYPAPRRAVILANKPF